MTTKSIVHWGMLAGALILAAMIAAGWRWLPDPEGVGSVAGRLRYVLSWQCLYALPVLAVVGWMVLKRYQSDELLQGYKGASDALSFWSAVARNTLEQQFIAVLVSLSFGALCPVAYLKLVPVHAFALLFGRALFILGYQAHPLARIPGFVIGHYFNIGLMLACLFFLI